MSVKFDTQCLSCGPEAIAQATLLIRAGQVVGVPTETVYGLAADATRPEAVQRIYEAKGRPAHNPLIVHLPASWASLEQLVAKGLVDGTRLGSRERELASLLMQTYWPGPLTLILPRGPALPTSVAAGLPTLGFRVPQHAGFLGLLESCQLPLAAPSANRSNRISPTEAAHVMAELRGRIPLILDGGPAPVGVESTIVAMDRGGALRILRYGGVSREDLESTSGQVVSSLEMNLAQTVLIEAPGMMREHYAPSKPTLLLRPDGLQAFAARIRSLGPLRQIALLSFGQRADLAEGLLPPEASLVECELPLDSKQAAQLLFKTLRDLDSSPADAIVVILPQDLSRELWPAINDRLTRASARWSS